MAKREQLHRAQQVHEDATIEEQPSPDPEESNRIKAELDGLLDDIDEVLEENAEEFVRAYVQKGGE